MFLVIIRGNAFYMRIGLVVIVLVEAMFSGI